jgi:hypothetical protein
MWAGPVVAGRGARDEVRRGWRDVDVLVEEECITVFPRTISPGRVFV